MHDVEACLDARMKGRVNVRKHRERSARRRLFVRGRRTTEYRLYPYDALVVRGREPIGSHDPRGDIFARGEREGG